MECPFKVGDKIHEVDASGALDVSKPDAMVTEITEKGFKYNYDTPFPIGRIAWGELAVGGECYPLGIRFWKKV